jgi:hypothetical protein
MGRIQTSPLHHILKIQGAGRQGIGTPLMVGILTFHQRINLYCNDEP